MITEVVKDSVVSKFTWFNSNLTTTNFTVQKSTTDKKTFSPPVCMFKVVSALTLLVGQQEGHPAYKKTEWWGAGVVIRLERGADLHTLHMAQLMPHFTTPCMNVTRFRIWINNGTANKSSKFLINHAEHLYSQILQNFPVLN